MCVLHIFCIRLRVCVICIFMFMLRVVKYFVYLEIMIFSGITL